MNKYSLVIGRFQPLHEGHIAMIQKLLDQDKPVCVAIMDTEADSNNPYTLQQRVNMVFNVFDEEVKIISIPPIAEVCYGRNVGYDIKRIHHDKESISASEIRESDPIGPFENDEFVRLFKKSAEKVHQLAVLQGIWPDGEDRDVFNAIALAHSELSEALECHRLGNPPDKNITDMSGLEVQLSDVLGILMDMEIGFKLNIAKALARKMEYNKSRGYLHGGKKF